MERLHKKESAKNLLHSRQIKMMKKKAVMMLLLLVISYQNVSEYGNEVAWCAAVMASD